MDRFFSQVSDVPVNTNKLEGGFLAKYSKFMKGPCLDSCSPCLDSCTSHCSACLLLPATTSKVPFDNRSSVATNIFTSAGVFLSCRPSARGRGLQQKPES